MDLLWNRCLPSSFPTPGPAIWTKACTPLFLGCQAWSHELCLQCLPVLVLYRLVLHGCCAFVSRATCGPVCDCPLESVLVSCGRGFPRTTGCCLPHLGRQKGHQNPTASPLHLAFPAPGSLRGGSPLAWAPRSCRFGGTVPLFSVEETLTVSLIPVS